MARELAERQSRAGQSDGLGRHNLIRQRVGQHAVLVDARVVHERVPADDRLVLRHIHARDRGDGLAGLGIHARIDAMLEAEQVAARLQRHHNLLGRGVPRALAQSVERAFDLTRARHQRGERIGRGHAEVVVAVHRDSRIAEVA